MTIRVIFTGSSKKDMESARRSTGKKEGLVHSSSFRLDFIEILLYNKEYVVWGSPRQKKREAAVCRDVFW